MIKVKIQKKLSASEGPMTLDVDFQVMPGELLGLFGVSGAGKTAVLRMIAGLTEPDEGTIEVDGDVWFDRRRRINRPVQQRRLGLVFQESNLFPHMTVRENLRFAFESAVDEALLEEYLHLVELHAMADQFPATLSGGQRQRVALVRALVRKPKIFLLDEPLAAQDMALRGKLQDQLSMLQRRFQVATIFVSHDIGEVFTLAHRLIVLEKGRITRSGAPADIFGGRALSGKFQFAGQILAMAEDGFMVLVTVQIGANLVKVVATREEARLWRVGDQVVVASKAFNPIILRVNK